MKEEQDYIRDIKEMRSMMERSSRFLSLSGLAGVMAGIYALAGAFVAYRFFHFRPGNNHFTVENGSAVPAGFGQLILLALAVLMLAIGTAILLSRKKAAARGEKFWNPTTRRLLVNMAVPLVAGGLLILVFISRGLIGFVAPLTLLFYGLALFTASKFTYEEIRSLGLIQVALGLAGALLMEYGLLFWALGFGIVHIVYGIYMHYRYER